LRQRRKNQFSLTNHLTPALSPNSVGGEGESFAANFRVSSVAENFPALLAAKME
jgi:hypothetical protein